MNGKGRFDKALIEAKQQRRSVELILAIDLPWTDGDGSVTVKILDVDTYAIKVLNDSGRESWVGKGFIVDAAILDRDPA